MPENNTRRKWWVLIAVGTGSFMAALDGSVVNTILPVVQRDFSSTVASIEWVVTVYLLVISGLLLTFGRLGDLHGHKITYLIGFFIFVGSSAMCGWAQTAGMLVLFRGIQAIGGAMLASNSPAILTANFPAVQRGQVLGLSGMMTYMGLTAGPSLGGWLAGQFTWRFVFFINIPVGFVAILLGLILIPRDALADTGQKFDLLGAATFLAGLVALLLGLNKGADWGWTSLPILALLAGAVLILTVFILIERHSSAPMLDLALFKNPLFSASTAGAVLNYICVYTLIFLTPFFLMQARGLDASQAGLILTAQPIIMAIAAPISGTLSDRVGSRLPGMIGMGILAAGLFLMSTMGVDSPVWLVAVGLGICGLGTGIYNTPNNSALMGSAPKHRQGVAAGILASGRNVGMVLGVGLAGAILTSLMARDPVNGFLTGIQGGYLAAGSLAILGILLAAIKER